MKRVTYVYALCFALTAFAGGTSTRLYGDAATSTLSPDPTANQETWISIFVHGIVGIKPHLNIGNVLRLVCDDVLDTEYALAVELTRGDPFFFQLQPIDHLGLIPIHKAREGVHAATALAVVMDSFEEMVYPTADTQNDYYTFGWSGLATHSARLEGGKQLYYALEKLAEAYKAKNHIPKIRIIGYSHGGNVVLNLGAVKPLDYEKHSFFVDELVLLGTPVLCESDFYVQSKLFKEIFHIYSRGDRVQIIDCLSYKRFFSNKIFSSRPHFTLPCNLKQIEVRCTDKIKTRSQTHILDKRIRLASDPAVITGSARFLRDRSPGHLELWYFGWLPCGYRDSHLLYPLPISALVPFIINAAKTYGPITPDESLIVDLRPRYGQLIVRQQYQYETRVLMPFLSFDQIKQFEQKLAGYKPKQITPEMQHDHVYRWCNIAQKEFRKRRRKKRKKRRNRHQAATIDVSRLL